MKHLNRSKSLDLVAGSERILRVHHRNMVHSRYLQHSLETLDTTCKRNLNRVQQEIYNVYYSEYLPLQEWKKRPDDIEKRLSVRRGTKRFDFVGDGRVKQKCVFPFITESKTSLYSFQSDSDSDQSEVFPLPSIFNKSKQSKNHVSETKEIEQSSDYRFIPLSVVLKIPEHERLEFIGEWKDEFDRHCRSVVSRMHRSSPEVDDDRLNTIRRAIALSSQPTSEPELKKNKKLRRSFLASLRKQSCVTHNATFEVNKDINGSREIGDRLTRCVKRTDQASDCDNVGKLTNISDSSIKEFNKNVKVAPCKLTEPFYKSFPSSSVADSHFSNSPDLFSEIHEQSSYEDTDYDDFSYTSGSASTYWDYTDGESSETE